MLAPESVDAVARRVVELLAEQSAPLPAGGLVDAATVARALGVSRATVYEHAAALGARQLGTGARPRLRFDLQEARDLWASREAGGRSQGEDRPVNAGRRPGRRAARSGRSADLLPIGQSRRAR